MSKRSPPRRGGEVEKSREDENEKHEKYNENEKHLKIIYRNNSEVDSRNKFRMAPGPKGYIAPHLPHTHDWFK